MLKPPSKRMFLFLGLSSFCFDSFGRLFAFRLVRKREEKVPKCAGKGPPEARICGSSGNPRKRKKGCVKSTGCTLEAKNKSSALE